jgi:hypothetical protein
MVGNLAPRQGAASRFPITENPRLDCPWLGEKYFFAYLKERQVLQGQAP